MGIFMLFTNLLPEAICCRLQTCNVFLVMYCMYILAFIVTSAAISQLYLCYIVYKLVMFMERG